MNNTVSVHVNVHIGDHTFRLAEHKLEKSKKVASEITDKLRNRKHNFVDNKLTIATKDIFKAGEFFLHKASGVSKKIVKALIAEQLPGIAFKIIRVAPTVLGIIL